MEHVDGITSAVQCRYCKWMKIRKNNDSNATSKESVRKAGVKTISEKYHVATVTVTSPASALRRTPQALREGHRNILTMNVFCDGTAIGGYTFSKVAKNEKSGKMIFEQDT